MFDKFWSGRCFLAGYFVMLTLMLEAATIAPVHCAAEPITGGERFTIASKILGEDRTIMVSVPVSYAHGTQRYPVLYLTDAQWQFDQMRSSAGFLARNGMIPEVIVVGVANRDRTHDLYATRADFKSGGRVISFPTSGNADQFLDFVEKELIPWAEGKYRTAPLRILAGHSAGGNFAFHAMRAKPGLFQAIVAASPWMAWDDFRELNQLVPFLVGTGLKTRVLFVSSADEGAEMQKGIDALTAALRLRKDPGLRWDVASYPGETHDSTVVKSYFDGLRVLFREWNYPRDPQTNLLVGSLENVQAHYARFGEHLGYTQLPPEYVVNELGYQFLHAREAGRALEVFRYNTQMYPLSANVWDSLADALELDGKIDEAAASCRKAIALAEQHGDSNLESLRKHAARLAASTAEQK
ncbi:MAG: alpha/beta hydrolase [Acidobacteriaceae bacterium]|nr:alpha/beta hydrolase [Acidobacteriaceae bacterium]